MFHEDYLKDKCEIWYWVKGFSLTFQILHDIDETDPAFKPDEDMLVKIDRQGTIFVERLVDTASQGQLNKDV